MLQVLLNAVFGCSHQRTTFPCTPTRRVAASDHRPSRETYVVCLDCGQEFSYDWEQMRIGKPVSTIVIPTRSAERLTAANQST